MHTFVKSTNVYFECILSRFFGYLFFLNFLYFSFDFSGIFLNIKATVPKFISGVEQKRWKSIDGSINSKVFQGRLTIGDNHSSATLPPTLSLYKYLKLHPAI
jgi:hypothetical protein